MKRIVCEWINLSFVRRTTATLLPLFAILGAALFSVANWFRGPYVIYYIDNFVPFNAAREISGYASAWNDLLGTGETNGSNLFILPFLGYFRVVQVLGLPVWLGQFLLFFLLFGGSGVSCYFLLRYILSASWTPGSIATVAATSGAILYMFNPYNLFFTWTDGMPFLGIMMAFMPLFTLSLWRITEYPARRPFSLAWLGVFVVSASMTFLGNVPYILSPVVIALAIMVVRLLEVASSWANLVRRVGLCVGLIGLILAVNAWWLVPEFLLANSPTYLGSIPLTLNQNYAYYVADVSPSSILAVMSFGGIDGAYAGSQIFDSLYLTSSPFLFLGLGLFAWIVVGLVILPKSAHRSRPLHIGVVLALLIVFALAANVGPGSQIVGWLVRNSSFWSPFLRYPYAGLGALIAFLFSLGVALSMMAIATQARDLFNRSRSGAIGGVDSQRLSDLVRHPRHTRDDTHLAAALAVVVLITVGLFSFPLVTGDVVPNKLIGVSGSPTRVQVPSYEETLADFLSANSPPYKDLLYPPGLLLVHQDWAHGYVGGPLLPDLSGIQTVFSPNAITLDQNALLPAITYFGIAGQSTGNFSALLTMLGVKYVVVDPTISSLFTSAFSADSAIAYLSSQPDLIRVGNFSPAVVFENSNPLPPVFASSQVQEVTLMPQGQESNLLPDLCESLAGGPSLGSGLIAPPYGSVTCSPGNRTLSGVYLRPPGNFSNGTFLRGPGFPSVSNTIAFGANMPLGQTDHYLEINISTMRQTGVSIYLSNYTLLNVTNIGTGALNSAFPVLPVNSSDTLGPDEYSGNLSLLVDLHDTNGFSGDWPILYTVLNYVLFSIYPVKDGKAIPLVDMKNEIGFNLTALRLVSARWSFDSPGFDPHTTLIVANQSVESSLLSAGPMTLPRISFTRLGSSEYEVQVRNASGPFVLNLGQTFDPSWIIRAQHGLLSSSEHFEGDLYLNSWLINPAEHNFSLELYYTPQTALNNTAFGSYAFPFTGIVLIMVGVEIKRRRRAE